MITDVLQFCQRASKTDPEVKIPNHAVSDGIESWVFLAADRAAVMVERRTVE
ncbi:hypothetical protein NKH09_28310 [Mesorhizobium sp. M1339]|uniref:hypothetical protein n=1 Tax=Mesorhizobium sp. M1339 TaxID=2957086 RepID=UPI00333DC651